MKVDSSKDAYSRDVSRQKGHWRQRGRRKSRVPKTKNDVNKNRDLMCKDVMSAVSRDTIDCKGARKNRSTAERTTSAAQGPHAVEGMSVSAGTQAKDARRNRLSATKMLIVTAGTLGAPRPFRSRDRGE
jgi:hypothetical protein